MFIPGHQTLTPLSHATSHLRRTRYPLASVFDNQSPLVKASLVRLGLRKIVWLGLGKIDDDVKPGTWVKVQCATQHPTKRYLVGLYETPQDITKLWYLMPWKPSYNTLNTLLQKFV